MTTGAPGLPVAVTLNLSLDGLLDGQSAFSSELDTLLGSSLTGFVLTLDLTLEAAGANTGLIEVWGIGRQASGARTGEQAVLLDTIQLNGTTAVHSALAVHEIVRRYNVVEVRNVSGGNLGGSGNSANGHLVPTDLT